MIRLSDLQWERIRHHFPEENIADGRPGRRPVSTRQVLEGTLWILNTGAQWHMLPQCYPNYKTVHRRFQTWCRSEVLRGILMDIANELRERGVLDEEECFIDATFVMAKGGGAEVGPTKRGKGMKIMAIVDRHGLPLSVSTHAANHHEVRLVQLCFDFYMIEAKPENLIGDRAYDSDPLDHALRQDGIEMIAPHRSNRTKPPTQDRRRLRRFLRRWLVERFFAWTQWQRRILVRWEYHPENFLGFVSRASLSSSGDFEIGSTHRHVAEVHEASMLPSGRFCTTKTQSRPPLNAN
jgi:transposase